MVSDRALRLVDVSSDVARRRIHVQVARQLAVLVANHRRPWRERDRRELRERDLGACGGLYEDPLQVRQGVTKSLFVPDIHGIALPTFDGSRDVLTADGRLNHLFDIANHQTVPGDGFAIDRDVGEVALCHPFRVHASGAWDALKGSLDLAAEPMDFGQVRPENLDPDRRLDTRQEHVEPVADRLGPDIRKAWKL